MRKKGTIYLVIAILTLGFLLLLEYNKPKEVNWFPSFVAQHKIPYGTYVLRDILERDFEDDLTPVRTPPFEFLTANSDLHGTYFFVNDALEFGETELDALLEWTARGNTLFLAAQTFEKQLKDTLGLETSSLFSGLDQEHQPKFQLVNPQLQSSTGYTFTKDIYTTYFSAVDTLKSRVVGTVYNDSDDEDQEGPYINVIRQPFGDGFVVISAFPKAFTNYFILGENNKDYVAGILSYIDPSKPLLLDAYYKTGKPYYTSPMYIFLNTKELKWAYYMALFGVLLYIIFEGKRKQRAIPVVKPLRNQTLDFTRTIADMYYEKGERAQIAKHKIEYFLDFIRSHFYLDTQKQNQEFYQNLASRSGHSPEEIKTLFEYLDTISKRTQLTDEELKELNTRIEKFKAKANAK